MLGLGDLMLVRLSNMDGLRSVRFCKPWNRILYERHFSTQLSSSIGEADHLF